MSVKKITIITPCYNSEKYIAQTIRSVLNQNAVLAKKIELEYIICDGNSTDGTVEIVKGFNSPDIYLISEKDNGMYDALSKGLAKASGDVCAYLNAGDYYNEFAFDILQQVFSNPGIHWLTGYNVIYNEESHIVNVSLPYKYRRQLFKSGFYNGKRLPFVQQESTFWRRPLNSLIDFDRLKKFRYAGDYYLWFSFSAKHELYIVQAYLGGFKKHQGQLSESMGKYISEINSFVSTPGAYSCLLFILDKIVWMMPQRIKKAFNKNMLLQYDHKSQTWI